MNPVEDYIYSRTTNQRDIMIFFHELLIKQFSLTPNIKWKIPVYNKNNNWLIYLNPDAKSDGVHLSFANGSVLTKHKILEQKGRKLVASVFIKDIKTIPYKQIIEIISESVNLDNKKHKK